MPNQALVIVDAKDKQDVLHTLLRQESIPNALIFCNRKRVLNVLFRSLLRNDFKAGLLHDDLDPSTRTDMLEAFERGEITHLVCAGTAACRLSIEGARCVLNFDVPTNGKSYRRRIGCTDRPSRVITIATTDEARYIAAIESFTGQALPRKNIEELTNPPADRSSSGAKKCRTRKAATPPEAASRPKAEKRAAPRKSALSIAFGDDVPAFLLRPVKLP